jgi:arylsulfatase A-like enzyme
MIKHPKPPADPYRDVQLDVVYRGPAGAEVRFPGFFDGGDTWRFRFMPDRPGVWSYEATFSDGAPGARGQFRCAPSRGHGPLVALPENPIWFGVRAGPPGDAVRPFLVRSFHVGDRFFAENWPAADRKAFLDWAERQGYNTLSIGSHYLNRDSEGRGRGWKTPDLWPLDAAEYRKMEGILDDLAARRMFVYPFAGFFGRESDFPSKHEDQALYIKYTLARIAPYWNSIFNVGGPEPLLPKKTYLDAADVHRLAELIRGNDPFGHLLTVHNPTGDDPFRDAPWLAFGTLQGPRAADRVELAAKLRANHHPAKPLLAHETLWSKNEVQMRRRAGGLDYTDDEIRKYAYVINLSAAALNFGDMDGNSSTGFSGNLDLGLRNQRRHDLVRAVWDFFEKTPYHKMKPCPEAVTGAFCLGQPGGEYIVYAEAPGNLTLRLPAGRYDATWIDARDTRRRKPAGRVAGDATLTTPPGGDDWILRLRGRGVIAGAGPGGRKPDVLFIAVDDLNDWVEGLGGHPQVKTPNLARLAAKAMTFGQAHAVSPVCNPSRAALLSGLRPWTTGLHDNKQLWFPVLKDVVTLPQHFRSHGYRTISLGKLFHRGKQSEEREATLWDETRYPKGSPKERDANKLGKGHFDWGPVDLTDEQMPDHQLSTWAAKILAQPPEKPLFLAVGFIKPHLPWYVPRKYFDLYPLDTLKLPVVKDGDLGDVPARGVAMARTDGDHQDVLRTNQWKIAVQAYLAAISFADAQIGRLLDALEASPRGKDTIVVLWGDHGFHLGEKEHWRKFTLWERGTRTPLYVLAPGVTKGGSRTDRPVDLMALYPTLTDLAGLPTPTHVQGASLRPLLADPAAAWERPAVVTRGRGNHAVLSEHWRYIRYEDGSEELYDHRADPNEWSNLLADPASAARHKDARDRLARALPKHEVPDAPRKGDAS